MLDPLELLSTLRQLQPRLYSISSSQVGEQLPLKPMQSLLVSACMGMCSVQTKLLGTLCNLHPYCLEAAAVTCLPWLPSFPVSAPQLEHPQRVQVTVAVVRYTSLGADRLGVCSTQLGERLGVGQQLPVYIHRNPDFRWVAGYSLPALLG
jgi:hypothetical protein